jgi:hypothetical protein
MIAQLITRLRSIAGVPPTEQRPDPACHQKVSDKMYNYFWTYFRLEDDDFELPTDFRDGIDYLGDQDVHLPGTKGGVLWGAESIIKHTQYWATQDYYEGSSEREGWLCIGQQGAGSMAFLCCTPRSNYFGQVLLGVNNSPWNDYSEMTLAAGSYEEYLQQCLTP